MSTRSSSSRPTSADVARHAGVSRATVSYVLNDTPGQTIPAATREKVLAAASALGYRPSAAARTLRRGTSDLVLALMPDWPGSETLTASTDALARELQRYGLTLLVHPGGADLETSSLWSAVTPAAVLADHDLPTAETTALADAGVALLPMSGAGEGPRAYGAEVQRLSGRAQAEHLVALGHTAIAVATPDDARLSFFSEPRRAGVVEVCAEHGLEPPVRVAVPASRADAGGAVEQLAVVATGVCAYNDEVAAMLIAGAADAGVAVPADLSIVGVDDVRVSALLVPGLTTVRQPVDASARSAAARVADALGRAPGDGSVADPLVAGSALPLPELVTRGSTAPPR